MHSLGCRSCAQCSPGCWCSLGWALLAFRLLQPLWGTPLASRVCAGFGGLLADLLYVGVSGTALSLPSPKFMTVLVKSDQKSAAVWGYVPISVLWAGGAFCDPRENIRCSCGLSVYFYYILPQSSKRRTTKLLWWKSNCVHELWEPSRNLSWGPVREGEGNFLSSQQLALGLNKSFKFSI